MLQMLKDLMPSLDPRKVLIDFEKACISAVNVVFSNTVIKGCYFHLCKSISCKSLAALVFVPEIYVRLVFGALADTFPDDEKFNELLTYFFSTYIESAVGRDPQFPIRTWNHQESA